jgi:biopolymer transport protein ExbD
MTLHDDAQDEEMMSQINITPLTDCMMVLLIIFMIASTALSQTGFNIQLPRVSTNEESRPSQIVISVAQNGDIFVGAHRVAPEKLEGYLAKLAAAKQTKRVVINGDRESSYGSIVTAMDCSKKAGLTSIALATKIAEQE